ncbi:hypothetical protein [Citrobacter sp. JL978]|uniref:hypothetical protein n=1 Tax=Citrobacter sp. JL978 TaxID=2652398 RepID=UPI0012D97BF1|nr:hypothetical protein [Citrobacter sp. JL978]MTZ81978.1 hypothetical protein [Citrobacter sp. JL978]
MLTNSPQHMNDTKFSNTVQKLKAAMKRLREHQEEDRMVAEPEEFDPSPTNALGIRAHAIRDFYANRADKEIQIYLAGLGHVREHIKAARNIINADGKKKYEAYIKNAVDTLPALFCGLKPYYLDILTDLMDIPFRRSAEKDRRELSDSLCLIASFIQKYRYRGTDERYREYAQTILRGIDVEQLPPMISGLIIQEITTLVESAHSTGVMAFVDSGITHEELWRYDDPDEYSEVYHDGEIPEIIRPLEDLEIYSPHYGIAQQSMWYGHDIHVDDFIVSLAGGLLYTQSPLISPS